MNPEKYICIDGRPVCVTEEVYRTYYRMRRIEKTLVEKDSRNRLVHYSAWSDGFFGGARPLTGASVPTPEEIVIAEQTRDKLKYCLSLLPETERDLIHAIFFEGKTIAKLSEQTKIPKRTLGCRRDRILKKLRKMMSRFY